MDRRIQAIEKAQLNLSRPPFRVGDTVRVHVRIREDEKTRLGLPEVQLGLLPLLEAKADATPPPND